MNRFVISHSIVILILATCGSANSGTSDRSGHATVQTFLVLYKPVRVHEAPGAERYDLFIEWPFSAEDRAVLRRDGKERPVYSYLNMIDVEEGVTSWAQDILTHHPGTLLRTAGTRMPGETIHTTIPVWGYLSPFDSTTSHRHRYTLDPRSVEWSTYFADLALRRLGEPGGSAPDGLFVDNVWPFYTYFFRNLPAHLIVDMNGDGKMDARDDREWSDAMISFSRRVKQRLPDDRTMIANFGTSWEAGSQALRILAEGAYDGAMDEQFLHFASPDGDRVLPDIKKWHDDVSSMMLADSLKRKALAQSLGRENDVDARLFCLGSFLLGAGPTCYFNYRYVNSYVEYFRFPEFDLSIGTPLQSFQRPEDAFDRSSGTYRRRFSDGEVIINPGASPISITVPPGMEQLVLIGGSMEHGGTIQWITARSVTLAPSTAVILRQR